MNMHHLLFVLTTIGLLAGCEAPEETDHLYKFEGSYGGEDYVDYSLTLPSVKYVSEERRQEAIEADDELKSLSQEELADVQWPLAAIRFSCGSRDEGVLTMTYRYLESDVLDAVAVGDELPYSIGVDGFERTVMFSDGLGWETSDRRSSLLYIFWDAEKADELTVETPLTPKTVHPIEKYRSSLSKLIRICRGFAEGETELSASPVEELLSFAHLPAPSREENITPGGIFDAEAAAFDCSLSQLRAGVNSRACAIRRELHLHMPAPSHLNRITDSASE